MQGFMLLYQAACVLLPCALVYALLGRRGAPGGKRRWPLVLLFALYVLGVFQVTGAGTVYEWMRMDTMLKPSGGFNLNLLPFSEEIDPVGYALNVVLLLPFGFLAPLIWPKLDKLSRAALGGFCFSLLIELSQLVNFRSSDVDDLILNTLGAAAGFALFRLYARLTHRKAPQTAGRGCEPALYIGAMFFGWFLLYNGMGAAALLYGG